MGKSERQRFYSFTNLILFLLIGVAFFSASQAQSVVADISGYMTTPLLKVQSDSSIAEIISHVDTSTVKSCIKGFQNFGTRLWTNRNRDSVFRWVYKKFVDAGVADVKFDSFTYNTTVQQNVVATFAGTLDPNKVIVIGGHLDSQNNFEDPDHAPGADDNASGTSAVIEMARVLRSINYQPAVTLKFVSFAAEEAGLRGSRHFAQEARSAGIDIKVMMNYDMIGYRQRWQSDRDFNIVWYTGSEAFSNLHAAMAKTYTTLTPFFTTSYRPNSDSYSFIEQSYHSVFCIERDFIPTYHTPNDIIDSLDISYACDIIKSGLAMLLTLDMVPPAIMGLQLLNAGNGTTIVSRWDSSLVPDFAGYNVHIGTAPGVYDSSYFQAAHERTFANLLSGKPYYIDVTVVDLAGLESAIVEQTATPLVSVHDVAIVPMEFRLEQNYPNPFNPLTTIEFTIPTREYVSLKVYNTLGQEVTNLIDEMTMSGSHKVHWDASAFPSGVYLYRLQASSCLKWGKMIFIR
jgi:hypothetical protein